MIYNNETGDKKPFTTAVERPIKLTGKFERPVQEDRWEPQVGGIVPEPVIDDYEVKVVFNDGTKTALYFKELDFIKDLGWTNVDRIIITARWK